MQLWLSDVSLHWSLFHFAFGMFKSGSSTCSQGRLSAPLPWQTLIRLLDKSLFMFNLYSDGSILLLGQLSISSQICFGDRAFILSCTD